MSEQNRNLLTHIPLLLDSLDFPGYIPSLSFLTDAWNPTVSISFAEENTTRAEYSLLVVVNAICNERMMLLCIHILLQLGTCNFPATFSLYTITKLLSPPFLPALIESWVKTQLIFFLLPENCQRVPQDRTAVFSIIKTDWKQRMQPIICHCTFLYFSFSYSAISINHYVNAVHIKLTFRV